MVLTRIKQFIDNKKIAVSAFERSIGMANASFGKSLKNGGTIGADKLENILRVYPEVSAEWLLRGEGEMIKQNVRSESEVIAQLLDKITELARENGQLRELLRKGGSAENAGCSSVADVG